MDLFQANQAEFSPCRLYRYRLVRDLGGTRTVTFCMMNPSIADEVQDDPTVRRCKIFARDWGFGRLVVVNAYAYRATDPDDLEAARAAGVDVVGPDNDAAIQRAGQEAELVVVAWGTRVDGARAFRIRELLPSVVCLGVTKGGAPRHPLYVPKVAKRIPWPPWSANPHEGNCGGKV